MKISEMITDRYKLRLPPTVYYDLLADVREAEEEQEPKIVPIAEIKFDEDKLKELVNKAVLTVTPQEPQTFKWCTDCKEYDQEKHCCHRWSKVIRNTVEEMKQEYIEREVLDKVRAEIEQKLGTHGYVSLYNRAIYDVLMIVDKYKAENNS